MRSFLVSCVVAVVLGLGAAVVLDYAVQRPSETAFTTTGARI